MRATGRHHGNLRATLLDYAQRVVVEQGADALSLRDLARAAGVSHDAPRKHFSTRAELLEAVAVRGFAQMEETLVAARDAAGADLRNRIDGVSRAYIDFAHRHAPLVNLMYSTAQQQTGAELHQASTRAYQVFSDLLAAGQQDGLLLPGDPDTVGLPFFAAIHGLAALVIAGTIGPDDMYRAASNVIEYALRGIQRSP